MLSPLVAPVLLLLFGELVLVAKADDCTTFPSWTIKHFRSNTSDTVGNDGTASFSLTNNLSGVTDDLRCKLEANYRCTIVGTPSDKNLTVTFAIRSASLQFSLDEVLDCPNRTACVSSSAPFSWLHFPT